MSQPHPGQTARGASEGVLRLLFGIMLAVVAVALVLYSAKLFAIVMVVVAVFGAREWHRMVRTAALRQTAEHAPLHLQTAVTGAAIALAVAALLLGQPAPAFAFLVAGAAIAFLVARRRDDNPPWHAIGVFYLGLPVLALVALRSFAGQGAWVVLGLFLIVWATDTAALVFGRMIGGPRLAPRLSPKKTWAGTICGSVVAALVFGLYIGFFGFNAWLAIAFAFGFSAVAHLGDLLESVVKRRFGYKDSGGLIPGHGGVLDRMDSLFAASVVMALLVFGLHFNPLFGGHV